VRKRVEEIFGWMKTVGGFRKTRYVGLGANQIAGYMIAAAYNLLRIAKLWPDPRRLHGALPNPGLGEDRRAAFPLAAAGRDSPIQREAPPGASAGCFCSSLLALDQGK